MKCKYCGSEIQFIRSMNQKPIPCNKVKLFYKPGGNERLVTPGGKVVACTIVSERESGCEGFGFTAHFATCGGRKNAKDDGEQMEIGKE